MASTSCFMGSTTVSMLWSSAENWNPDRFMVLGSASSFTGVYQPAFHAALLSVPFMYGVKLSTGFSAPLFISSRTRLMPRPFTARSTTAPDHF